MNIDKVALLSISSLLLAGSAAGYLHQIIRKRFGNSKAARYVALASLTAIPTYATAIYDIFIDEFGIGTINRTIGFALWAAIFVTAAFMFGRFADFKDRHQNTDDAPTKPVVRPTGMEEASESVRIDERIRMEADRQNELKRIRGKIK